MNKRRIQSLLALLLAAVLLTGALSACGGSADTEQSGGNDVARNEEPTEAGQESDELEASADALSFSDAKATELSVTLDGEPLSVTLYEDCYVTNPTTVAMIPDPNGEVDQRVSVYVPENATKESPIIFCVMNWGWIQDAYAVRPQIEDGAAYVSDSNTDRFGAALSRGFVIVTDGVRSRGDNPTEDGEYVSHSPATVTDTKAVIRYLRYNANLLPAGDPEKIVITGTSGGGALSTIISASGNSPDYFPSLYEIGAAGIERNADGSYTSTIGDNIFGTIAYCPINDLREADAAYEFTYGATHERIIAEGAVCNDQLGSSFQDPFTDTYAAEDMMAVSAALAERYGEYVDSLNLKLDDGTPLTKENLREAIIALLTAELDESVQEYGVSSMLKTLSTPIANHSSVYNPTVEGYVDWLNLQEDGSYDFDYDELLYFVARNTALKVACAFSNAGMGIASASNQNEDSLFGTAAQPYSAFEFYSWNHDATAGNGVGPDDTGLDWDAFLETEDGQAQLLQMQMASPIPYLTGANGDSAPHWYVRHGMADRDTSFALQTILRYAISNADDVEDLNFEFAWLLHHDGDYDVQEAYAWLDGILAAG